MADEEKKAERRKKRKGHKSDRKRLGTLKATGRRIGEVVQNLKGNAKRNKAARVVKRHQKDIDKDKRKVGSTTRKKSEYRDTRVGRLKDKSKEMTEAKFKNRRWDKADRKAGVKEIAKKQKVLVKSKATVGAKRATKVLDRIDKREQRQVGRKQNKTVRQNRMDTGKSPSSKSKKKYEKDMKRKGIDINKKVKGLNQIVK
jgi:hypothetical protein